MQKITLKQPDDWHVHLRDGNVLATTVPHIAERFARTIVMPNLRPPVVNTEQAIAYRQRILSAVPKGLNFNPLMTLYLTDTTDPDDIVHAKNTDFIKAYKLYPAGATTNSQSGVTKLFNVYKIKVNNAIMSIQYIYNFWKSNFVSLLNQIYNCY